MTPLQDASQKPPQYPQDLESSLILPKQRADTTASLASLPYRTSNPSLHKLFESTASISTSRPSSGTATPTASGLPGAISTPGSRASGTGTPGGLPPGVSDEHRTLIQQAFAPHAVVVADAETEDLIRGKGLEGGLLQLLRPFGEHVTGKVTIRDSVGASKSYEDFGVRFVSSNEGIRPPEPQQGSAKRPSPSIRTGGHIAHIEELVDRHLQYTEFNAHGLVSEYMNQGEPLSQESATSPFYTLYLRRLLSGLPLVPHESFAHPVAGVIVTSSRSPDPVQALRDLYHRQQQGDLKFPPWVDSLFLRYYVFIHEEETGDIVKSNATFDSMKRHFGLNCHLLRLKGQQCISSDDDAVRLPTCQWMSASEELAEIQKRETSDDISDPTPYIPDSDVTAIKTFVRELVAQSMIPHMERNIHQWNEQVLARRRGLSGRFMSLSKRWTTFGSRSSSTNSSLASGNSNYDPQYGFYRPDSPEALMRRLADYCFMLRDTKLALSTYDVLTTDYTNDKAWSHYASAAEMAALSALLAPSHTASKVRPEKVDEWIKWASYSYTERLRTPQPFYALRTLLLSIELLRLRGASAADDAARWGARILETRLTGPVAAALVTHRVSACYAARPGSGPLRVGSRRRKAAFWALLAADAWVRLGKALQAERCLESALALYATARPPLASLTSSTAGEVLREVDASEVPTVLPYDEMHRFVDALRQRILALRMANRGMSGGDTEGGDDARESTAGAEGDPLGVASHVEVDVEEATETLDTSPRAHRKSLVGATAPNIDVGPLSPTVERAPRDESFE